MTERLHNRSMDAATQAHQTELPTFCVLSGYFRQCASKVDHVHLISHHVKGIVSGKTLFSTFCFVSIFNLSI